MGNHAIGEGRRPRLLKVLQQMAQQRLLQVANLLGLNIICMLNVVQWLNVHTELDMNKFKLQTESCLSSVKHATAKCVKFTRRAKDSYHIYLYLCI